MKLTQHNRNKRVLAVACVWALAMGHGMAHAVSQPPAETRPRINLFPTSVVENLSETSRAARQMENDMYDVVARL